VVHPRGAGPPPRHDLPGRGLHPPEGDERLAKIGYTQSYSYFTWRNTKTELTEYLTELTREEAKEHMRPNFFVNTPDINPVWLQTSGRPGFRIRAVLAATLSPLWGVYSGFELCEATPVPGREEYLDSEKYEIKAWDWDRPGNIRDDVTRLNRVRRENPAMWDFTNLEFHPAWNDHVMVYSKMTDAKDNLVVVAVNLDPRQAQGCHFEIPLWRLGPGRPGQRRGRGPRDRPAVRLDRQDPARLAGPAPQPLRHLAHRPTRAALMTATTAPAPSPVLAEAEAKAASAPSPQDPLWYKDAIIYQTHIKAFFDSNGDGVGDFAGLAQKLDHIQELGVSAVWLLPFYPSPLRDDGYDIAEYRDVNPLYGTIDDVKRFVEEAHRRGLKVITELVINHTSDQHPWFQAARRDGPDGPYRDYYVWSDTDQKYAETASSSPTPRSRTGPGTPRPAPTSGTASIATSPT
jgi:glycosidase